MRPFVAAAAAAAALLGATATVAQPPPPLAVTFNDADASFAVLVGGSPWFASAGYALHVEGAWRATANGTLALNGTTPLSGDGPFGAYTGYRATWDAPSLGPAGAGVWETSLFVYAAAGAVVFEQAFPRGAAGTALGGSWQAGAADVCTAFPLFGPARHALDTDLAYLTFDGGHSPPRLGRWTAAGAYTASMEGGAVTAWWNASGTAAVLSALDNVGTQRGAFSPALGELWAQGFNGALREIPAGWRAQSLLVAGASVNDTFYRWGDLMLAAGNKARTGLTGDPSTAYLSAWTDNGANYYYNTESNATTYQQTMLDWLAYSRGTAQLPVRSLQFDSCVVAGARGVWLGGRAEAGAAD
jgi:hypothetical protein